MGMSTACIVCSVLGALSTSHARRVARSSLGVLVTLHALCTARSSYFLCSYFVRAHRVACSPHGRLFPFAYSAHFGLGAVHAHHAACSALLALPLPSPRDAPHQHKQKTLQVLSAQPLLSCSGPGTFFLGGA